MSSMTLGLPFLHLENEDGNTTYLIGLLQGFSEPEDTEHLRQCSVWVFATIIVTAIYIQRNLHNGYSWLISFFLTAAQDFVIQMESHWSNHLTFSRRSVWFHFFGGGVTKEQHYNKHYV